MDNNIQQTISGYTNDDVNTVLKQVFENVVSNRQEVMEVYDSIKERVINNDPDSIFLLDKVNDLLENSNRQNDILVRLAGVMQRLQTNVIVQRSKNQQLTNEEFNALIEKIDENESDKSSLTAEIKFLEESVSEK